MHVNKVARILFFLEGDHLCTYYIHRAELFSLRNAANYLVFLGGGIMLIISAA
ncbi:hypothetical protein SLEP1_g1247 [Rubroshorea leprosula]|uniref:Uncharacterized protein n=1 Tax=Rubroshorea leprosula TaxID=152421 RepID=A0AAV5HMS3_9ROSI|nr:hypothetical protein SLEP1_g1247 [Rubroshorea leprosula]